MKAAATQFPLPEGMNLPPDPAPLPGVYLVLFSFEEKKAGPTFWKWKTLVKIIRASLQGGQYHHTDGGCTGLYRYCRGDD